MNPELQEQYKYIKGIVEARFTTVIGGEIDQQITFLQKVMEVQGEIIDSTLYREEMIRALKTCIDYKAELLKQVDDHFTIDKQNNFDVDFLTFNQDLERYIQSLDELVARPQDKERFDPQEGDTAWMKFQKWFKRLFFIISKWPERSSNFFRKIFKKPGSALRPWTHTVHFRDISWYFLKEKLSMRLIMLFKDIYLKISQSSRVVWRIDEKIERAIFDFIEGKAADYKIDLTLRKEITNEINSLQQFKATLEKEALAIFEKVFTQYGQAYLKAGTFELSNSKFSAPRINKVHYQLNKDYKDLRHGWDNLLLALSDDWEIDLQFYLIIYSDLKEYHVSDKELRSRIEGTIAGKLNNIINILKGSKERLGTLNDDTGDLQKAIKIELDTIKEELSSRMLMSTNELILMQDLPALVNNVESKIDLLISSVSEKRAIVKGVNFDEPVKSSTINYVSPYELIHFESWPQLVKVMKAVKINITESLSKVQNEVIGLGQIAEFNLESALALFDDESKTDNPKTIALEGIDRTIEKVEAIKSAFQSLEKKIEEDLIAGLKKFNQSLISFTDNENIYEIRVRIAKGKALQKSKELKERILYKVKNFIPTALIFVKSSYFKGSELIKRTFKKYGISGEKESISAELADFLAETQLSIEKLPFVYQRLFKAEPLTDINFFEGRNEELQYLNNAYNNWTKGRFASVAIVGEKGSGITTLLNFFLKGLSTSSKVYRFFPETNMITLPELITYFSIQFDEKFTTLNDIVTFLNSGKKVVIIENIQNLYLKKVNGFDAVKWLTELISLTSKKVFWITSCTKYAWGYLDKSINISDHFNYHVLVKEFDDATIINIINKRHKVSGYNVEFEPSSSELNNKKFKKLTDGDQQDVLREHYFNELNKIAKSNVSLGLIYWLRSTKQIEGNTIFIGSLKEIDFSFMKNLSTDKIFALAVILFHDGLSEAQYSSVTTSTIRKTRNTLYPLYEDGILILNGDKYYINPLLYRQTTQLLKSKNIIH